MADDSDLKKLREAEVVLRAAKNAAKAYPEIKVPIGDYYSTTPEAELHRCMQHLIALVNIYEQVYGEIPKSYSEVTE